MITHLQSHIYTCRSRKRRKAMYGASLIEITRKAYQACSSVTNVSPHQSIYHAPSLPAPLDGTCNIEVVNPLHTPLIACKHRTKHKFWIDIEIKSVLSIEAWMIQFHNNVKTFFHATNAWCLENHAKPANKYSIVHVKAFTQIILHT